MSFERRFRSVRRRSAHRLAESASGGERAFATDAVGDRNALIAVVPGRLGGSVKSTRTAPGVASGWLPSVPIAFAR